MCCSDRSDRSRCSRVASRPSGPRGDVPREDFWSLAIGVMFANCAQGFTDQLAVQRWLTISNVRQAKVGVYQSTALQMLMMMLMSGIGLSIYAYYASAGTATWNFYQPFFFN